MTKPATAGIIPDKQLIQITKLGTEKIVGGGYKSDMVGFGDLLSDEEIVAVLAFIKSTWPPEIIEVHDPRQRGRSVVPAR